MTIFCISLSHFHLENSVRGLIAVVDFWLNGDYECKDLYPCWCSVVYLVAHRVGGKNPAAAMEIAKNWKGVVELKMPFHTH